MDITGAETINILATKSGGTVIFANLINNYNIALYITETIARQLDIRCADGYLESYDEFDFEIVREMAPYIQAAEEISGTDVKEADYPIGKKSQMMKTAGAQLTLMDDFICESKAMQQMMDEILTVSKYDCNVMVTGAPGAGKEMVADVIHKNSDRNLMPFIKVNCGSIPAETIEEEFFGKESGGKAKPKKGCLEKADNGALFLDDVEHLPQDMQIKLFRAIQDGEFYRVGGKEPIKTNVRIISATGSDIETEIDQDRFRRDLYYQLNVVKILVPSLHERGADIPGLVDYYLRDYGKKLKINRTISQDAVDYLCQCEWPGNARELENMIQKIMIGAKSEEITLIDVMREMHSDMFQSDFTGFQEEIDEDTEGVSLDTMVENFEKNIIRHALEKYGSTRKAANAIGISQTQLVRKKNKYGI